MFAKKHQKKESLNFKTENYIMKDEYKTDDLVAANLEYISNEAIEVGPMVHQTDQIYIFEPIIEKEKIRYREIFTGLITDAEDENHYFNLPYVVNIKPLIEVLPSPADILPKYSLLLVLNEINRKKAKKEMQI